MKTLTVRLPDALANAIEAESRRRGVSKSDIVRERLLREPNAEAGTTSFDEIADLVGAVDGSPRDLSGRKKAYLRHWGYGRDNRR